MVRRKEKKITREQQKKRIKNQKRSGKRKALKIKETFMEKSK